MSPGSETSIEPLGKHHDRTTFHCGQPALDDWFRHRASQDEKRNVARVFVAVTPDLGVIGFYSLNSLSLSLEILPEDVAHKLPRYHAIPAALIGRLATMELLGHRLVFLSARDRDLIFVVVHRWLLSRGRRIYFDSRGSGAGGATVLHLEHLLIWLRSAASLAAALECPVHTSSSSARADSSA